MNAEERLAWDMYFTTATGFLLHPGNRWENSQLKNHTEEALIQYAAHLATLMMHERRKRDPNKDLMGGE